MQKIPIAHQEAARIAVFKGGELHGAVHPAGARADGALTARDYAVELATHRVNDPAFRVLWRALVAVGPSPQKVYQTPEFFQFLSEILQPGERLELFTVVRQSDAMIVGVVPLRLSVHELDFNVSRFMLYARKTALITLLGSIPAVPQDSAVLDALMLQILAYFPSAKGLFMHSLPADSALASNLGGMAGFGRRLGMARLGQWRACHTMPVPETFELYLNKFSAKKRYNLKRQIRLLGEQAGPLELVRVERPDQVAAMCRSLASLASDAEPGAILSERAFTAMARENLLLAYVLRAGDTVLAAIVGTRSSELLHLHNIFVDKQHLNFSVGTSVMHLAIEDMIKIGGFSAIDFGYGTPNNDLRSSHVLETRAKVLLFDRHRAVSLLFMAHCALVNTTESVIDHIKLLRQKLLAMRKAAPVKG